MIIITGSILARADAFEEMRQASLAHVARSRTEDGCHLHSVHVDAENPLRLVFIEHWRDRAAVLKHFADPGARMFTDAIKKYAAAKPALNIYEAAEIPLKALMG